MAMRFHIPKFRAFFENPERHTNEGMLYSELEGTMKFWKNVMHWMGNVYVMQYIDERDINGKEICEGDVLLYKPIDTCLMKGMVKIIRGVAKVFWYAFYYAHDKGGKPIYEDKVNAEEIKSWKLHEKTKRVTRVDEWLFEVNKARIIGHVFDRRTIDIERGKKLFVMPELVIESRLKI